MENDRRASRGNTERYDLEILLRRPSLRASIPRRVSQICRETVPTEETTCGLGCVKGRWLQSFANRSSYIFIYGAIGSFYGSYYAYFYSVITTLEKRFKISSQTIGVVAFSGDILGLIMSFLLSMCTHKVGRPKVLGFGVLIIATSTLIFTLPHFLNEPRNALNISENEISQYKNETDFRHCTESSQTCTEDSNFENGAVILLILAQMLHGFGGSLYFISGKSYEDDNVEKHQQLALKNLVSVLKILGPAFGYWLSSVSLKIFEYPTTVPEIAEDEPRWIGAWWLGSLVIGFILIVPGFLVTLFPTTLPKAAVRIFHNRLKGSTEIKRCVSEKDGKVTAIKRIFIKRTLGCAHFGAIFNIVGFMAYFIFLPKYVEIQYRISPSNANLISGSLTLISSTVGIVTANSVISRNRPSARALARWTIFVGFLSIGALISYIYLGCQENDNEIKEMIIQHLNTTCKCISNLFLPVCDEYSQSFISPCHSGCDNLLYFNNTEGFESCYVAKGSSNYKKIFRGFCYVNCHSNFVKFTLVTCLIAFLYATGYTSHYWFEAKYEENNGKSILNSKLTFFGLLATLPAPIVFGHILDNSCLLWERNCSRNGNCWLYDNEKLRFSMNLTAVGFALIGIIFDLGVWYSVKNLELFHESGCNNDENYG